MGRSQRMEGKLEKSRWEKALCLFAQGTLGVVLFG